MNYYNEFDPKAAAWLRELIKAGHIPQGEVDERSITDVRPSDLDGFTQCHFFAGIGGWPYALRLAGVPEDTPVWTGSCPCQPFSTAGKRGGTADERHLWPAFRWLIAQCQPPRVFGEQVASKAGRAWWAGVQTDLEALGYRSAAADLCAASVGAPHIRQRLFWVAHNLQSRREAADGNSGKVLWATVAGCSPLGGMAVPELQRCEKQCGGKPVDKKDSRQAKEGCTELRSGPGFWDDSVLIPCADGKARRIKRVSVFQFDGIPGVMGTGWSAFLAGLKERILTYAKEAKERPGEILRTLWSAYAEETLQRNTGGHDEVYEAQILLVALCQLSRELGFIIDGQAQGSESVGEATMRVLWCGCFWEFPPCASYRRRLEEQQTREPSDSLRHVPQGGAQEGTDALLYLWRKIANARYVPETLPALEEVWRSVVNQDPSGAERIQTGTRIIVASIGMPLAPGLPGRVGLLRGYGNAIVPAVAAEFIKAAQGR